MNMGAKCRGEPPCYTPTGNEYALRAQRDGTNGPSLVCHRLNRDNGTPWPTLPIFCMVEDEVTQLVHYPLSGQCASPVIGYRFTAGVMRSI